MAYQQQEFGQSLNSICGFLGSPDASQLDLPSGVFVRPSTRDYINEFSGEEQRRRFTGLYRSESWLENIFERNEEDLIRYYEKERTSNSSSSNGQCLPHGFELRDIENVFKYKTKDPLTFRNNAEEQYVRSPHIRIVTGVDSLLVPVNKLSWGGFVQVYFCIAGKFSDLRMRLKLSNE